MCGFIGAQALVDTSKHGGRNPLVEMAQAISILGERTEEERALDALRGPMVAASAADDPRLGRTAADPGHGVEAANPAGSFEAFAAMFGGNPHPVPGREQANGSGGG